MTPAIALIGGAGLSIGKRLTVKEAAPPPIESQSLTPQIPQPQPIPTAPAPTSTVTQKTVILVPRTQEEFDCIQYGGGMGCFANNYTPNTPNYYNPQEQEWQDWEAFQKRRQETLKKRAFYNTFWGFDND